MNKFSIRFTHRYDYRRILKVVRKEPKLHKWLTSYAAKELFFECETETDATLLAALLTKSLKTENIEHEMLV